jgi:hypothetical protein
METSKNKNQSHGVKIPQSKLNYDNRITKDNHVTAKEIEDQINLGLGKLGKSREGGDDFNLLSEMIESSMVKSIR